VTVVALASIKGSPGVTTAALAMAARWPAGRKVLLVEADPFGGDLAPRYGATVTGGLASLLAAARRELTPEAVWDHVNELPGGLAVLFGLAGVRQAAANENVWPAIAAALAGLDADVVVDAGRLLPQFAGGVGAVLGHADALVVVCGSALEAIVHLQNALPELLAERRGRRLLVVPTGAYGYSADDIATTLEVEVGPAMPDDREAAAALANQRRMRRLETTPLLMWASAVIAEFGIDDRLTGAPTTARRTQQLAFDQAPAPDAEMGGFPVNQSASDEAVVGAGTKSEARQ
jgi:hypothetical protein